MSKKSLNAPSRRRTGSVAPVRVRLKRLNCNEAVPYPRDGQTLRVVAATEECLRHCLKRVRRSLAAAAIAAARLPGSGISETAVNASLAFIEGAKPQGEIECALVIQMACTHSAAMSVLGTFAGAHGHGPRCIPPRCPQQPDCCAPTQPRWKRCAD